MLVGRRDCTKLVDGVLKQAEVVKTLLGEEVPVHAALCFVDADWPLIGGSFTTREVEVLWPKKLVSRLAAPGALEPARLAQLHAELAKALPPA